MGLGAVPSRGIRHRTVAPALQPEHAGGRMFDHMSVDGVDREVHTRRHVLGLRSTLHRRRAGRVRRADQRPVRAEPRVPARSGQQHQERPPTSQVPAARRRRREVARARRERPVDHRDPRPPRWRRAQPRPAVGGGADLGCPGYVCTFENGSTTRDVPADHVVLALPFTTLRAVDLSGVEISPLHRVAIDEEPLGTNSKLFLQFDSRVWNADHQTGNCYDDGVVQGGWEASLHQPGQAGILAALPGGEAALEWGSRFGLTGYEGIPPTSMVDAFLDELRFALPRGSPATTTAGRTTCGHRATLTSSGRTRTSRSGSTPVSTGSRVHARGPPLRR